MNPSSSVRLSENLCYYFLFFSFLGSEEEFEEEEGRSWKEFDKMKTKLRGCHFSAGEKSKKKWRNLREERGRKKGEIGGNKYLGAKY